MDSLEDGSLTSSMVDDAFFVVKKCTRYMYCCVVVNSVDFCSLCVWEFCCY